MNDGFGRHAGCGGQGGHGRGPEPTAESGGFEEPGPGGRFKGGFPPGGRHWHGGPPPWAGGRRARRGDIRWALLLALADAPAHGYELIGRLEARTGGAWRPSAGSVYPTLQLLEEEGLVVGHDDGGKRVFELTEAGRASATEASRRIGRGPWSEGSAEHGELRRAVRTLLLAVRQVTAVGDDAQLRAAIGVVTDARRGLYRILGSDPAGEPAGEEPADGDGDATERSSGPRSGSVG